MKLQAASVLVKAQASLRLGLFARNSLTPLATLIAECRPCFRFASERDFLRGEGCCDSNGGSGSTRRGSGHR